MHPCTTPTCHGEDADEDTDAPAGEHDVLAVILTRWLLLACPDSDQQDQDVEHDDTDDAGDVEVDHLTGEMLIIYSSWGLRKR